LLFATEDDCVEFRAAAHGIVIETALIYTRHNDAVAESDFPLDALLSRLMAWLDWNIPGSIEHSLEWNLGCYDERRARAEPSKRQNPTLAFFTKFGLSYASATAMSS
jgi:hypothetical protein